MTNATVRFETPAARYFALPITAIDTYAAALMMKVARYRKKS